MSDNNNAAAANAAAAPAPAINSFYIIVTKEQGTNKLSIEDINDNTDIPDNATPTEFITDTTTSGKFAVKVEVADKTGTDYFQVGDKYYKLSLDESVSKTDVINNNIVHNSTTFAAQPTTQGGQKQVEDQQVEVDGGQKKQHKEKKNNHRNRNYSKKNRKSRSKSDTLRNYFNYNAIETM